MKRLVALASLVTSCMPSRQPTPGGLQVTGPTLSFEERQLLDDIHAATRQCLREHDFPILRDQPLVRVESTCLFDAPGYDEPQAGYAGRDYVVIGRGFDAFAHELGHYYPRDRRHCTKGHTEAECARIPAYVCEHPIKFERLYKCEERP